jgi:rfaE bifunctional protein nucleotidyltransferase chain/domain
MIQKKICSATHLSRILDVKRKKNTVVFTNGCFDLLHAGHVTYLEKARKLGDILVVALNADESVKRLKGSHRPVNDLQDRASVIAALESVSYVTWFSEDTPLKIIQTLKPDFLVKGGDYKPSEIVGHDEVVAMGGKVKVIPFLKGRSTTSMISRMSRS